MSLIFGWAYKHDAKNKERALWDERQAIRKSMDEIGVFFSDGFGGDVTVYSGGIADGNRVSPLHDGSYRESA